MRFLKLALFSLLVIFLLFTAIGLLMPSSVTVTRKANINAVIDSVRFYTNDLSKWQYWLNGVDTNYNEASSAKNAQLKLGVYTISVVEKNQKYITTLWQSEHAKNQLCRIHLNDSIEPNLTTVYFSFQQHLSWLPWDRLGGMLHDEVIGPSMQSSLDKLKQVVEKTSE
jgi:hypothetical protein